MARPSRNPSRRYARFLTALAALAAIGLAGFAPPRQIEGRVVDFKSGQPLSGIVVAAAPDSDDFVSWLAGDRVADATPGIATAVTDANGSFTLALPFAGRFIFDAFGAPQAHVTFHGTYAAGSQTLGTVRLIEPSSDERAALAELNRFRGAPGGVGRYGAATRLVFDEDLMESARFWAGQEVRAGRIGHTCGALGDPPNCIEFNAFFHGLPGAPQDWSPAQNAAFDAVYSWADPNSTFEIEGRLCAPAYNWHGCGYNDEVGHFVNIMSANRWVGLGAKGLRDGVYYAMNLI
ncbi:MAG: hypothetical protein JO092_04770 [Candidatus Eremiobacteraeota bacterium]|nr:hypothetical protein [Candidatus Eremiobacteraeota bacterium]